MKPFLLETNIGNVWVSPTEGTHAYISFSRDRYQNPDDADKPITVRGVSYTGSIHVYQHTDGAWYIGPEFKTDRNERVPTTAWDRSRSLHVSRLQRGGIPTFKDDVSDSAKAKLSQTIIETFRLWQWTHPEIFNVAEENHVAAEKEKRQAEIVGLREKIATLEAEIKALETEGK